MRISAFEDGAYKRRRRASGSRVSLRDRTRFWRLTRRRVRRFAGSGKIITRRSVLDERIPDDVTVADLVDNPRDGRSTDQTFPSEKIHPPLFPEKRKISSHVGTRLITSYVVWICICRADFPRGSMVQVSDVSAACYPRVFRPRRANPPAFLASVLASGIFDCFFFPFFPPPLSSISK